MEKKRKNPVFMRVSGLGASEGQGSAYTLPNERAAEIAVQTVKEYKQQTHSEIKVIFNVFKELDEQIYQNILS